MATTVGGIRVRIIGDDSDLQKKLADSSKAVAKYAAAAGVAAAAAATALTVQGLKAVDAQAKLARSLNTTIDSLRAMQMAASEAGLDGMEGSLARLNRRLGAAEMGMGDAAVSVKALGLNLQELSAMEVDQRVAAIADAIRDSGMSMQQAARHAQNLGFEQAEAAAFFRQGGDSIRAYREEIEAMGLSLSEVDAAKVEQANDAFARAATIIEGVSQRLAIELAPILTAVSQMFTDAAKEAGGFGEATSDAFKFVVDASAFVMNAVDGIRRVFAVTADLIITSWATVATAVSNAVLKVIEVANEVPGVNLDAAEESVRNFAVQSEAVAKNAFENIHKTLMEPLPGDVFKEFVADARVAAEEAAQEAVKLNDLLRPDLGSGTGGESEEEKKHKEEIAKRLERIREANMAEAEIANAKFEQESEALQLALENRLITEQEWMELERQQKARHEDELTEIEKRASDARQNLVDQEARNKEQATKDMWSNLASLMNSESRKLFEIGKAAAIANTVISTWESAGDAAKWGMKIGGPPLAAAFAGAAVVAGFARVQSIASQSFGGGKGSAGGAGAGSGSVQTAGVGIQGQQEQSQTMFVQGINPNDLYSGEQMVNMINMAQENGAVLRVSQ